MHALLHQFLSLKLVSHLPALLIDQSLLHPPSHQDIVITLCLLLLTQSSIQAIAITLCLLIAQSSIQAIVITLCLLVTQSSIRYSLESSCMPWAWLPQ